MTAIAFIIFNRPDLTQEVFGAIAQAKPERLLVISDGPRADRPGEAEKVKACRAIIDQVNWPCEVLRNYSEVNLGCKRRVSSGITWVFEQVEEAIILEDDCLPDPSFFPYCEKLLERYRDEPRVMMISGDCFLPPTWKLPADYCFSKYGHIWGWASWRRAWKHYDVEMRELPGFLARGALEAICPDKIESTYWKGQFEFTWRGEVNTWDYQWLFTLWNQGGLSVMPAVNLISNLGFRADATHTAHDSKLAQLEVGCIGENLNAPPELKPDAAVDQYEFDHVFDGVAMRREATLSFKVMRGFKQAVKQVLKTLGMEMKRDATGAIRRVNRAGQSQPGR